MKTEPNELISLEVLAEAAECLRTIAHPHRLRILELLLSGEHTVGDLANVLGVSQAVASTHLGKMRDRGVLALERRGRSVYYRVAHPGLEGIMGCIRGRSANSQPDEEL